MAGNSEESNDYHAVSRASQEGELVAAKSELGRQFRGLARQILGITEEPQPETSWKVGLKDLFAFEQEVRPRRAA